jgi:phytoene/squalene synthetase
MKILPVKNKKQGMRQITIVLPVRANTYITLYALAKGLSRSIVIRDVLESWLAEQDDKDVIIQFTDRLLRQWKVHKMSQPVDAVTSHKEFLEYLALLEDELRKKGIEEYHIEQIINGMTRDGKN